MSLQPYQTISIDLGKLKDSKKTDTRGQLLPAGITRGQFVWHQETPYSMIGRAEETSASQGIARSFSCDFNCCANYQMDLLLDTPSFTGDVGGSGNYEVEKEETDCSGYYYGWYPQPTN